MKDECGVFGCWNVPNAAELSYLGLYALQHRGQESAGIVTLHKGHFYVVKDMGLVSQVFNPDNLNYLKGHAGIGHVRYSTTGSSNITNVQPLYSKTTRGKLAIAHNGNITNAYELYLKLREEGALFQSTVDSELILHLISRSKAKTVPEIFQTTLARIEGAFSLVALGEDYIVGARDPWGFRPLVLGQLGKGYVIASETCALDLINAKYVRDIEPGEIVLINDHGVASYRIPREVPERKHCIFEYVYFARPDSLVFTRNVHVIRKAFGRQLAREYPVAADIVVAIPDSGNSAALGYAEESGIPFELGITRNHYVGRTFIQPSQHIRDFGVKVKLNPVRAVLEGKRVVVVDDSLVRGTTSRQRVDAIRAAGAKEIHLRISSPPVTHPCHYGIDTPKRSKLIAAQKSLEEIRKYIGADSLGYLSKKGMLDAVASIDPQVRKVDFCTACFDGNYPVKVRRASKHALDDKRIKLYAEEN